MSDYKDTRQEHTMNSKTSTMYATLRAEAYQALLARDTIENCCSAEWRAAHAKARALCLKADSEMERLAKEDRRGEWAGPAERELMLKGWL